MSDLSQKKVAELVTENINTAHVFKKHGIDFCCGGGISIAKACEKNSVNMSELIEDLNKINQTVDRQHDFNSWKLDFLIDHIINIHHSYVQEALPIMIQYADKVASVHGHHYTEVVKIKELVHEAVTELSAHLKKEENILFPYAKAMIKAKELGQETAPAPFGYVENPIRVMEAEHDRAGDIFKEIRRLSNNYTPPAEACNTFKALYALLNEFETDLHQHVHLENNILFPKVIQLELSKS